MSTPPTPTEARQLIRVMRVEHKPDGIEHERYAREHCTLCEEPWPCLPIRVSAALEAFLPTEETEVRYTPQEVADYAKSCNVLDFKPSWGSNPHDQEMIAFGFWIFDQIKAMPVTREAQEPTDGSVR